MKITVKSDLTELLKPVKEQVKQLIEGKEVVVTAEWPVVEMFPEVELSMTLEVPPDRLKVVDLQLIPESEFNKDGMFLTGDSILSLLFATHVLIAKVELVADVTDLAYPEVVRYLWKEVRKWKNAYNNATRSLARDEGYIPASQYNLQYVYRTLCRMSQREGRPKPSRWDVKEYRGTVRLTTHYARVLRRTLDHLAHAVSAGWIRVEWPVKGRIIRGKCLNFRDGQIVTPAENDEVVLLIV